MRAFADSHFRYPAGALEGNCAVEVYRDGERLLVVLEDRGQLEPVTETLAWEVSRRVLEPRGLAGLDITWLHVDSARGKVYEVAFADARQFVFPLWREVSRWELEGCLPGDGPLFPAWPPGNGQKPNQEDALTLTPEWGYDPELDSHTALCYEGLECGLWAYVWESYDAEPDEARWVWGVDALDHGERRERVTLFQEEVPEHELEEAQEKAAAKALAIAKVLTEVK